MSRALRALGLHGPQPQMHRPTCQGHRRNSGKTALIRCLRCPQGSDPTVLHSSMEAAMAHFTDKKTKTWRAETDTRTVARPGPEGDVIPRLPAVRPLCLRQAPRWRRAESPAAVTGEGAEQAAVPKTRAAGATRELLAPGQAGGGDTPSLLCCKQTVGLWGLPCGSDSNQSACSAGDPGVTPG